MRSKHHLVWLTEAYFGCCVVSRADQAADEAAIRALGEKYVESYNRRDSRTMAEMWSPEAVYMDPTTREGVVGREEIAKQFDYAFAGSEDAKLAISIESI